MTKKRIVSVFLLITLLLSCFSFTAYAGTEDDECIYSNGTTEIYVENTDISDKAKERIIAYYTDDDDATVKTVTAKGLTCSIFGHKLENTTVTRIAHKARTTAPRCLKRTYKYEVCTRCDYEKSTLISSLYINCCS